MNLKIKSFPDTLEQKYENNTLYAMWWQLILLKFQTENAINLRFSVVLEISMVHSENLTEHTITQTHNPLTNLGRFQHVRGLNLSTKASLIVNLEK